MRQSMQRFAVLVLLFALIGSIGSKADDQKATKIAYATQFVCKA
jgi:hypothetical protein